MFQGLGGQRRRDIAGRSSDAAPASTPAPGQPPAKRRIGRALRRMGKATSACPSRYRACARTPCQPVLLPDRSAPENRHWGPFLPCHALSHKALAAATRGACMAAAPVLCDPTLAPGHPQATGGQRPYRRPQGASSTTMSTRRLRARPSALPLSATGRSLPSPTALSRSASTPSCTSACRTASARRCDRV